MKATVKALVIEPSRAPEVRHIANTLEGLNDAVGGYLEAVKYSRLAHAYVDEEAKVRGDRRAVFNSLATDLCHKAGVLGLDDWIAGPFVLLGSLNGNGRFDGEEHDIPEETVAEVMKAAAAYVGMGQPPVEEES